MSRKDENFAIVIILLCIGAIWMTIKFTVWLIKTTYPFLARLIKEKKSTTPTPKYHSWEMPISSLAEKQNHVEDFTPVDEPKFKFEQISADGGSDDQLYHISMNIDDSWDRSDFDYARMQLQKIAYGMVGDDVNEEEREAFKKFMTQFAEHDPLYCEVMNILKPLLQQNKRLVQSTIYKHFPQYDAETLRYVLYFAHEIGHIYRVKKGRSYEITLIGETVDIG